jgi:hypothetical protein
LVPLCFGQVVERRKIKFEASFPKRRGIGACNVFSMERANGTLNSIGSTRKPYLVKRTSYAHLF